MRGAGRDNAAHSSASCALMFALAVCQLSTMVHTFARKPFCTDKPQFTALRFLASPSRALTQQAA